MAHSSCTVLSGTKSALTAEEVQRKLHRWFEEQGLLSDLRAHIRQLMIAALKGTQLAPQAGCSMHQNTSPKIQAINLLVAEFLLLQECHYTLSVFTSEVPLLRNLPEFSPSFKDAAKNKLSTKKSGEVNASPSRLQERHVWDILEALGFPLDSSAGNTVFKSYQENVAEPLLTCLIRSVSRVIRHEKENEKTTKTEESISVSDNDSSLLIAENSGKENAKNDQKISFPGMPVIREILQKLNVKPTHMKELENEIKRLIKATRLAEQENFHEKLLSYERRIQEERAHYEKELYSQIMLAQQQLVGQSSTTDTGLRSLETLVMAAIEKLQQNLRLVEERDKMEEREKPRQKMKKKESELPEENNESVGNSQQEISKKSSEKLSTEPSVQQAESQHDTGHRTAEKSSCVGKDITNGQGQMTPTLSKLQQESSVSSRDQSVQAGKPGWQVISDFEEVCATVQRLQQENEELRNLMQQQQVQVSELQAWGRVHMSTSVCHSPAVTHLAAPADLISSGPPPPLPPRAPQQHVLYHPAGELRHFRATGETCVAPASTQTSRNVRSRIRRLRRFPTPRRVLPSSEETSPTEEMLRDARRRLRELEEESEAVDRSYREFCRRQQRATPMSDVLADLLQPIGTEYPPDNGASAAVATGDPSGFKVLRSSLLTGENFSSESLCAAATRNETQVSRIMSQAQETSVHNSISPTVTQHSNVCLSDLIYNIPSSELASQQSISVCDQSNSNAVTETHTDSYQTAKMQAQTEVHTTHFYKTPLLSSTIGMTSNNAVKHSNIVTRENFDSGCGYNKHNSKSLNSGKMHSTNEGTNVPEKTIVCFQRYNARVAETVDGSDLSAMKNIHDKMVPNTYKTKATDDTTHSGAKGPERSELVTSLDNSHKTLKDYQKTKQETERQRIGLPGCNGNPKLYDQKPLKMLVLTDLSDKPYSTQTIEKKSEGNKEVLYQTTTKNDDTQLKERQLSSVYSLNATELSHPRLSDLILVQESSETLQDEKPTSHPEKDSNKYLTSRNLANNDSERSSLGEAEFIPAYSGDQLFLPSCHTDTETDPGTSRSDMLSINDQQNHPVYETEEQAISNRSISSEQPISAGKFVSSGGDDFW